MNDCIFCKIIDGSIPSYKIYEDEHVYAFLDIACDAVGHTLVIPKQHCINVLDCPKEYLDAVIEAVQKISRHYVEQCGFEGVNVLNSSGSAAQQEVFHLHFHIYPRKKGDGIDLPVRTKKDMDLGKVQQSLKMF